MWFAGILLLSAAAVAFTLKIIPWDQLTPDFMQFWTAGKIVASGGNPYDARLQARIQQSLGWDRVKDGLGIYDFLPYYYPAWFAIPFAVLVPLGYDRARLIVYFVNVVVLISSGYLVSRAATKVPRSIPLFVVPLFVLSPASLLMGQTAILVLFLSALLWCCLDRANDRSAGVVLAFLTIKPQLGIVLVLSVLLWAARRARWGIVRGFAVTMGLLALAGAIVVPLWPVAMARATAAIPPPTEYLPWIGTTWLLLLRSVGLRSWPLWIGYLALAVPFLGLVIRAALDRSRPASEIIALAILAVFIIAPYGRHYDFPILMVPLFVLMSGRLSELAGTALMAALLVLPYIHMAAMMSFRQKYPTSQQFPECTFLWIPALLTGAWLAYEGRAARRHRPACS
jgi:hypothetical protein